jgi:DNA-directed RNA polymerase subunit M/transcription elongation factor TFIIS
MAFQFQCPHCQNILQGEESQAGLQCQCPICSKPFIIPHAVAPQVAAPQASPALPEACASPGLPETHDDRSSEPPSPRPFPLIDTRGRPSGSPATPPVPPVAFEAKDPDILHIPCPECKQVLETPVEMLDQDVMCPHCQAQFRLRRRDSQEYKRKKAQELQLKEHKAGRAWLNWAIVAVILVLLFFAFLIFSSTGWD